MELLSLFKKKNNKSLFTTPSHGSKFCIVHKYYNWYRNDISEVDAYDPQKALGKAEKLASSVYGTKYTKFLTNGSTSGVIAALLTCAANKKVLIWKDAHICHKNGCKLANANVIEYDLPYDENLGVYRAITADKVSSLLTDYQPDVLLITSPMYEGFVADVIEISRLCKKNNCKLIVDEAHGALYPFSEKLPVSAVKYADYTIQSLHKTAGGINPTALLHSNDCDPSDGLNMITTTSPSYPMLATIEANINFLNSKRGRKIINDLITNIEKLQLPILNDDVTKILIKKDGLTGFDLSKILFDRYGIEDEKTNPVSTMLLCGIGTSKQKLQKLKIALKNLGF